MRAIAITKFGGPEVLQPVEIATPQPSRDEILVRIRAVGVNRADLVQRVGKYPPPPDVLADVPGLEYAGEVEAVGEAVKQWRKGDRVYGLAGGGTYAEYITVHARTTSRIPDKLSFVEAAAVPEAFLTAYDAMVSQCGLQAGETVLISAAGSGVGTAAVQIARAIGARAIGTARSANKLQAAAALGMDHGVVVADNLFAEQVLALTGGDGVDVVLELVGGNYFLEDVKCVRPRARLIIVGLMAGAKTELDLGLILRKRLLVRGTTMRMRPLEEKIAAAHLLSHNLSPLFESGQLKAVVDRTFPLSDAAKAHAFLEGNENFGKVVLEV